MPRSGPVTGVEAEAAEISGAAEQVSAALFAVLDRMAPGLDRMAPGAPGLDRMAPGALGIGVSGGSDSVGLLLAAAAWGRARGVRIEAATVDHRLRSESGAEAAGVAALCARLEIPHKVLVWAHDGAPAGNLAEAAREARRALLAAWARGRGLGAVALAHTLDDQAETVLLRLARGAGVDGLAGMAAVSRLEDLALLRPALGLRRGDLRALCRAAGEAWVEDPTNADMTHDRPKARAALAALGPLGIGTEGLAATAARMAEARAALEEAAGAAWAACAQAGGAGELLLDRGAWAGASRDLRLRLLSRAILRVAGGRRPRARALDPLEAALVAGDALPARSIAGALVEADAARIAVMRESARCGAPVAAVPGAIWDGRWRLEGPEPPAGALWGPLGAQGLRFLSEAERRGSWTPPPAWQASPRAARLAAPALIMRETLLCAPLARYDGGWPGAVGTDLRSDK